MKTSKIKIIIGNLKKPFDILFLIHNVFVRSVSGRKYTSIKEESDRKTESYCNEFL